MSNAPPPIAKAWGDLAFPSGYPIDELEAVQRHLASIRMDDSERPPQWAEWSQGITGHVYRLIAAQEHFDKVTPSLSSDTAPAQPERYMQEKWLFAFFYEGLSALECLYYAMYFVGTYADAATFSVEVRRKSIEPSFVASRYLKAFPDEPLSTTLERICASSDLGDWAEIRNVLSHRGHGGRTLYSGGERSRQADWNLPLEREQLRNVLELDELERRRQWLVAASGDVVLAADSFSRSTIV
jgi:hypothetical protein